MKDKLLTVKQRLIKTQYQARAYVGQIIMFNLILLACILVLMGLDRVIHNVEQLNRDMDKLNQKVKVITLNIKPIKPGKEKSDGK